MHLLVSNPPHGEIADLEAAAACLGLEPRELQARAARPQPELWLAAADGGDLARRARALVHGGLRVFTLSASKAGKVPRRSIVRELEVLDDAIRWKTGPEGALTTPFAGRLLGVVCEPKPMEGRPAPKPPGQRGFGAGMNRLAKGSMMAMGPIGVAAAHAMEVNQERHLPRVGGGSGHEVEAPCLDLYGFFEGRVVRLCLQQGTTRFHGLGRRMAAGFRGNLTQLVALLEARQARFDLDRRLANVELREPLVADRAYRKVWGRVHPSLEGAGRFDLASRLVFLSYCS